MPDMIYLILILCSFIHSSATQNAFASVLTTNDFVLPAKVLAHSLSIHNMMEPYVIFYTEKISQQSLDELNAIGLVTVPIHRIDTPFLSSHKAAKFQYTRLNLWAMTNYTTLVSLDLDVIVDGYIGDLFRCGSFCASYRHSDMFNAGVMVLKPNRTVFEDMARKVSELASYDGGDQGFLNSYFSEAKYAPMFNPVDGSTVSEGMHTLSMAYNYDVGAYYLQSRLLIKPLIIHFTLGPTKPWLWWTYPMFDLNWKWHNLRLDVEKGEKSNCANLLYIPMQQVFVVLTALLLHQVLSRFTVTHTEWLACLAPTPLFLLLHVLSLLLSFFTVPSGQGILTSWTIFIMNQMLILVIFTAIYAHFAHDADLSTAPMIQFACIVPASAGCIWVWLYSVSVFGDRCKLMFVLVPIWFMMVNVLCKRLLVLDSALPMRYQPLKTS